MHIVNKYEAVDINTEEHLLIAECIGNIIYNKYIKKGMIKMKKTAAITNNQTWRDITL